MAKMSYKRRMRIKELYLDGHSKAQIAKRLDSTNATVKKYLIEFGLEKKGKMKTGGNVKSPSKFFLGREITLSLPNGEKRKGQFAITDLDNIIASHNEETFSDSVGYPMNANGTNINDRNYKDDKAAQNEVAKYAVNLEPERIITTSRTPSGTPIVNDKGFVVSGNNRTMSLKLAAKKFPEKYQEYIQFLREEAEAFGFKHSDITEIIMEKKVLDKKNSDLTFHGTNRYIDIKKPVLVRIDYDIPDLNTNELAKYNKDTKKAERPIDKAIKLSNILQSKDTCIAKISDIIGQFETFSELWSDFPAQKLLAQYLMQCDLLTEQELPAYFSEGSFTGTGKEFVENILASIILDRDALISSEKEGVKRFKQIIITSLPVLIANNQLPEGKIIKSINEAIVLQYKIVSSGLDFQSYATQLNFIEEQPSKKAMYLNRLLSKGRNLFKGNIEKYNEAVLSNQGESLFGDNKTVDEIFEFYIEAYVDGTDQKIIEGVSSPTIVEVETTEMSQNELNELVDIQTDRAIELIEPEIIQPSEGDPDRERKLKLAQAKAKARERRIRLLKESFARGGEIRSGESDTVERLEERIDSLQKLQEKMKYVNKAHKSYKKDPSTLDKFDLTEQEINLIKTYVPKYSWEQQPFAKYQLTNNSQNINRLRKRLEAEKPLQKRMDNEDEEYVFDGGKITKSYADNNWIVYYDEIPDYQTRKKIKGRGFRWNPQRYYAWARSLTLPESYMPDLFEGFRKADAVIETVEESPSIEDLEKEYNEKNVDELVALKKELYPNPDVESAMSPEEKLLDKVIAAKFSDINKDIKEKRKEEEWKPTEAVIHLADAIWDSGKITNRSSIDVQLTDANLRDHMDHLDSEDSEEITGFLNNPEQRIELRKYLTMQLERWQFSLEREPNPMKEAPKPATSEKVEYKLTNKGTYIEKNQSHDITLWLSSTGKYYVEAGLQRGSYKVIETEKGNTNLTLFGLTEISKEEAEHYMSRNSDMFSKPENKYVSDDDVSLLDVDWVESWVNGEKRMKKRFRIAPDKKDRIREISDLGVKGGFTEEKDGSITFVLEVDPFETERIDSIYMDFINDELNPIFKEEIPELKFKVGDSVLVKRAKDMPAGKIVSYEGWHDGLENHRYNVVFPDDGEKLEVESQLILEEPKETEIPDEEALYDPPMEIVKYVNEVISDYPEDIRIVNVDEVWTVRYDDFNIYGFDQITGKAYFMNDIDLSNYEHDFDVISDEYYSKRGEVRGMLKDKITNNDLRYKIIGLLKNVFDNYESRSIQARNIRHKAQSENPTEVEGFEIGDKVKYYQDDEPSYVHAFEKDYEGWKLLLTPEKGKTGFLTVKAFPSQVTKWKDPERKDVILPIRTARLVKYLNEENDLKKRATVWNDGIQDEEGYDYVGSRGSIVPETGKTLWQIAMRDPNLDVASSGSEEKVMFNGDELMRAIQLYSKNNNLRITFKLPEEIDLNINVQTGEKEIEEIKEPVGEKPDINASFKNSYELNKAVEQLIDYNDSANLSYAPEELIFINKYSGYGGLEKFGATGKGILYEYFTPDDIIKRMWALAYKYGYKGGDVLENSCGTGRFFRYLPKDAKAVGYEINKYSNRICQLLYPNVEVNSETDAIMPYDREGRELKTHFDTIFIKNRVSIRNKVNDLRKFDLVIGNPPYGRYESRHSGFGEKQYTKASNYIDYFITRGLDLLNSGGLLVYIIGAEVASGGTPFLDQQMSGAKKSIIEKSDLIDAYRLPNGVFDKTDVLCDLIILRKR